MSETKPTGLELLRVPFPAHQISKLPKESKAQADDIHAYLIARADRMPQD